MRNTKINNPLTYLTNLVIRKGRSDAYGIYLTGVTVLAEVDEDYNSDVPDHCIHLEYQSLIESDTEDWNALLVETRIESDDIIFPISFLRGREPITVYFCAEGHDMSAMVFIPSVVIEEFPREVAFYQHMLKKVSSFAGKTPINIRFTLGVVSMPWEEAVERGAARAVDITY